MSDRLKLDAEQSRVLRRVTGGPVPLSGGELDTARELEEMGLVDVVAREGSDVGAAHLSDDVDLIEESKQADLLRWIR